MLESAIMIADNTAVRELTGEEIAAVTGAVGIVLNLGFVKLAASINETAASGYIRVGDGESHGGTIWFK